MIVLGSLKKLSFLQVASLTSMTKQWLKAFSSIQWSSILSKKHMHFREILEEDQEDGLEESVYINKRGRYGMDMKWQQVFFLAYRFNGN